MPWAPSSLDDLEHPVTAYLNGLAPSSRRTQLAALEAIARRSAQVFSAETMPWQRLCRPHVLKVRNLLEEDYLPATANRMLSALRGVLKECWPSGPKSTWSRFGGRPSRAAATCGAEYQGGNACERYDQVAGP